MTDKNKGGRPPIFKTVAEMQHLIDLYFLAIRVNNPDLTPEQRERMLEGVSEDDVKLMEALPYGQPTISGLAYTLGMSTETLRNYGEDDKFIATVKRAKQLVEMSLEQRLYAGAPVGAIFNLKNNFGWKDKTEQELVGRVTLERTVKRLDGTTDKDDE